MDEQNLLTMVTMHKFSKLENGENAKIFRLENGNYRVDISDYGATIISVMAPDRAENIADIVLGYSSVDEYRKNGGYFGATVGRYANRIANGEFELNGTKYTLEKNDGVNHLHGGLNGFDKRVWDCEVIPNGVLMSITSEDMEGGYPGTLKVSVMFTLEKSENGGASLRIKYSATSDKDTVINLTNHSYFNLNGHNKGDILRHTIKLYADRFTRVGAGAIPTGELPNVKGTVFDFVDFHEIGERLSADDSDLAVCGGYDHNFVLSGEEIEDGVEKGLKKAAVVKAPYTGRVMRVYTDMPGIQLYIGNMIDPVAGKDNAHYGKRSGFCLETQFFPDSPNQKTFPSCVIKANEQFSTTTSFSFEVE